MWARISFLDIIAHIRLLALDIKLPDRISIDMEMLVRLGGGTNTSRDVLVIRLEDVEYGAKFAFLVKVTKIPKLNPATATTRCGDGRRKPQCYRVHDV